MTAQPTIAFDQLSVQLGARTVLDAITLTLDTPGLVVLAGPNGAGKSTLLRTLAGLVVPHAGRCRVDGADIAQWSAPERARMIAYMPQDRAVHWNLSVRTLVALGRLPHRGTPASTPTRNTAAVQHALFLADATALADRPILSLSGGERARVLLQLVEGEFDFYGSHLAVKRLPRVACYFAKVLPDFASFRDEIQGVKNYPEFKRLVREHFTR